MSLLDIGKLEHTLQAHWTEFLDNVQIMCAILEHVRDTPFRIIKQENIPPRQTKITVTKFTVEMTPAGAILGAWLEFTVPKNDGVVIGTAIVSLPWDGRMIFKESFGTEFQAKNLKQHPES